MDSPFSKEFYLGVLAVDIFCKPFIICIYYKVLGEIHFLRNFLRCINYTDKVAIVRVGVKNNRHFVLFTKAQYLVGVLK
jgi:hypothetical protein